MNITCKDCVHYNICVFWVAEENTNKPCETVYHKNRFMENMEKLKAQNEALKRILKSKIKVYAYPICTEEHYGCANCLHLHKDDEEMPCIKCKGTVPPISEEYKIRKDYWSDN